MAILSTVIFGGALTASGYAIWATVRPELARIADLLVHGPVATPLATAPVPSRTSARTVRVRDAALSPRSPLRAGA